MNPSVLLPSAYVGNLVPGSGSLINGMRADGYPGLRSVWPNMPGCPNPEDPEHAHTPAMTNQESVRIHEPKEMEVIRAAEGL